MSIKSTISLVDKMTPTLRKVVSSLQSVIALMEKVDRTTENSSMSDAFKKTGNEISCASQALADLQKHLANMDVEDKITKWSNPIVTFNAGLDLAKKGLNGLKNLAGGMGSLVSAFNESVESAQRLTTLTGARGATREDVTRLQSSAYEVQLKTTFSESALSAGLSELATYDLPIQQLEQLIPTLADYAAGIRGVNVDNAQMVQLATQLGKAIDGNIGGLTMTGFTFSEMQKNILATGTAAERTAVIIDVIGGSYNGLAEALAQTPEGKLTQLYNEAADLKVQLAGYVMPAWVAFMDSLSSNLPRIKSMVDSVFKSMSPALMSIAENAIPAVITALNLMLTILTCIGDIVTSNSTGFIILRGTILGIAAALAVSVVATNAQAIAMWAVARATAVATTAQHALNAAMMLNPIGFIIGLVIALITYMAHLYKANENFRIGFHKVWNFVLAMFDSVELGMVSFAFGVIMLFDDMRIAIASAFEIAINFIIDKINSMVGLMNKIGIDIDKIERVAIATKMETKQDDKKALFQAALLQMADSTADKQAERNSKVLAMATNSTSEKSVTHALPNDFVVDTVVKGGVLDGINEPISIGQDDLKYLNDVANREFNLSYKQITPNIQITFGDVHKMDEKELEGVVTEAIKNAVSNPSLSTGGLT